MDIQTKRMWSNTRCFIYQIYRLFAKRSRDASFPDLVKEMSLSLEPYSAYANIRKRTDYKFALLVQHISLAVYFVNCSKFEEVMELYKIYYGFWCQLSDESNEFIAHLISIFSITALVMVKLKHYEESLGLFDRSQALALIQIHESERALADQKKQAGLLGTKPAEASIRLLQSQKGQEIVISGEEASGEVSAEAKKLKQFIMKTAQIYMALFKVLSKVKSSALWILGMKDYSRFGQLIQRIQSCHALFDSAQLKNLEQIKSKMVSLLSAAGIKFDVIERLNEPDDENFALSLQQQLNQKIDLFKNIQDEHEFRSMKTDLFHDCINLMFAPNEEEKEKSVRRAPLAQPKGVTQELQKSSTI